MKLTDTIEMMGSGDFKERFRAEYFQLDNRINGLSNMLDKYRKGTLNFTPKCSIKLLDGQLRGMITYKTHLVERAKIEGISLEEVVSADAEPPVNENQDGQIENDDTTLEK